MSAELPDSVLYESTRPSSFSSKTSNRKRDLKRKSLLARAKELEEKESAKMQKFMLEMGLLRKD